MSKLPENNDAKYLVSRPLLRVCIGLDEVGLHFEGNVAVTACSQIGHRSGLAVTVLYETGGSAAAMLVRFLGQAVVEAAYHASGCMVMKFANGEGLEIHDAAVNRKRSTVTVYEEDAASGNAACTGDVERIERGVRSITTYVYDAGSR